MHRALPLVLIPLVLLAGCRAATPPAEPGEDLSTYPPATTGPFDPCLEVGQGSIDALRLGIQNIDARNDVGSAAAIKSGDEWFVAAEVTGAGLSGQIGVWVTVNDPTDPAASNAYLSVDGTAANFSDYVQSPTYDVTSPQVDEAKACL